VIIGLAPKRKQVITTTSQTKGIKNYMKKAILVAIIGAMTLGVNAGDWGKAPVGKAPIEECIDLGGEISTGYMTDYIFYGARVADHSVFTDVNYTFDGLSVPITIGAWYLNSLETPSDYDELDLYISAPIGTYFGFDVSLGYTYFLFFETEDIPGNGEIGLDFTRSLGWLDFAAEANYNHNFDAWYYQAGVSKTFGITDNISLILGAGVGYSDNYFDAGDDGASNTGWNHWYASASLPIILNCRTTLTPYIGYTGGGNGWIVKDNAIDEALSDQDDILHGGVSLSVTF